jgi:hypothetical protein
MSSNLDPKEVVIKGNNLICCVCNHDKFFFTKTLMNTVLKTFLKLDWTDKKAKNYICENCSFVYWFLNKE